MQENTQESMPEMATPVANIVTKNNNQSQIAGAIVLAGLIIAGAILLKGGSGLIAPKDLSKASPLFNACLDSGKYTSAITDAKAAGSTVGVTGTPKGYIVSAGKVVSTIDGAEPFNDVKKKIDDAIAGKGIPQNNIKLDAVTNKDFAVGNPQAAVTIIMYEDFQCPFCGRFFQDSEKSIRSIYVKDGTVQFVYRDFPFLGAESYKSAEAASCANEQGKFWEYHDYLYSHQMGENQGAFSDTNLKSFAGTLKLK
ncbi:MAG: thioredoxin domain-containing protein [Patescibacteria group bacterium]